MLILPSKAKLLRGARTCDVAFNRRMPASIPGAFSRGIGLATIEPQMITPKGTTGAPTAYGLAGQIDGTSGQFRMINSGDTDAYGVLMRSYPTESGATANDPLGTATPPTSGIVDIMVRGYAGILLQNYAAKPAVKGGTVYVWFAASSGNHVLGGFEAFATGGSTLALPDKYYFTGPQDSNGFCEIGVNI